MLRLKTEEHGSASTSLELFHTVIFFAAHGHFLEDLFSQDKQCQCHKIVKIFASVFISNAVS